MAGLALEAAQQFGEGAAVLSARGSLLRVAGNSLAETDLETGAQELLGTRCERGINVLEGSGDSVALSHRGFMPAVYVFRGKHELAATLQGGAELEYAALAIAREGGRVAAVERHLTRKLCVWDVEAATDAPLAAIELGEDYEHVSFSPLDSSLLCLSGPSGVRFLEIGDRVGRVDLVDLSRCEHELETAGFLGHCWTREGHVVAVHGEGSLVKIDPHTGRVLKQSDAATLAAHCVQLVRDAFVVGTRSGSVVWLKESTWSLLYTLGLSEAPVLSLKLSPNFKECLARTRDGKLHLFHTDPRAADEVRLVADAHTAAITGLVPVYTLPDAHSLVASVSADGTYCLWDVSSSRAVARPSGAALCGPVSRHVVRVVDDDASSPIARPTALASSPQSPFVAIGTATGYLKTLCHSKGSKVVGSSSAPSTTLGHTVRAHRSPLSVASFDPAGRVLATASFQETTVCIFSIPQTGEHLALIGVVELQEGRPFALEWDVYDNALLVAVQSPAGTSTVVRVGQDAVEEALAAEATVRLAFETCGDLCEKSAVKATPTGQYVGNMLPLRSGRLIATGADAPEKIQVFDGPTTMRRLATVEPKTANAGAWALAQTSFEQIFATGSADGVVTIWRDLEDVQRLAHSCHSINACGSLVTHLCFTHDASLLVAAHQDGSVVVSSVSGLPEGSAVPHVGCEAIDIRAVSRNVSRHKQAQALPGSGGPGQQGNEPSQEGNMQLDSGVAEAFTNEAICGLAGDGLESSQVFAAEAALAASDTNATACERWKQRAQDLFNNEHERIKSARREMVDELQQRLVQLLENNDHVPELEKLDRDEFVIDVAGKAAICEQNASTADQLHSKIQREIKGRELVFERIKAECWDSMNVHSKQLHGLGRGHAVRNFPIPEQSEEEKRKLRLVTQQRSIELREVQLAQLAQGADKVSSCWESRRIMKAIPADVNWIVNAGKLAPVVDHDKLEEAERLEAEKAKGGAGGKADSGKGSGAAGDDHDEDHDEEGHENDGHGQGAGTNHGGAGGAGGGAGGAGDGSVPQSDIERPYELVELLYHPAALRSKVQMRSQLVLLRQVQREMMGSFNKRFESVVEAKEDTIDRLAAKYERINEILAELKAGKDPLPNFRKPSENPESIFEVSQAEVGVEKYLSKSERERLAREEEERKRREAEAAKDNMGERALNDMMNGTLEAPKEQSLAERELKRPEWMEEVEYGDMSDEQRREYDEFEAQYQKFMEEKEKYTKSLEVELKKLRTEVLEIIRSFDDALDELIRFKLDVTESVHVQGLYLARIALSLVQQEDIAVQQDKVQGQARTTSANVEAITAEIAEFSDVLELAKSRLQDKQEADKALERAFKTEIQECAAETSQGDPLDIETLRVAQQLYKLRNVRKRSPLGDLGDSARGVDDNTTAASDPEDDAPGDAGADPFARTRKEEEAKRREAEERLALATLDKDAVVPEGYVIEPPVWDLLQQLRTTKIRSELELRAEMDKVAELQSHYDELDAKRRAAQHAADSLQERLRALDYAKRVESQNLDLVIRVKQGQDEVKPGAVITDYSNSLLLGRHVVEEENKVIQTLGGAKVSIMRRMKDFRKNINYMQWEHKYMLQQEHDLEEHYTDLHMLRVTRGLQEVIKGGEVSDRQEQTQQAETKLSKMQQIHTTKMTKLSASLERLQDKQRHLQEENSELEARIRELRAKVQMRDSVLQARGGGSLLSHGATEGLLDVSGVASGNSLGSRGQQRRGKPSAGSGAKAVQHRMKSVVARRRLMDLARAQNDEIEFLKQELDQLRERNFPRFSNPSAAFAEKRFDAHPDLKQ